MTESSDAGMSTDGEALRDIFKHAMKMYDNIQKNKEPTNNDSVQLSIKTAISKFEKATNLVSLSGMFSRNETLEELPTDTLQYLLLPALLGSLSLKVCNQPRKEVITIAEIYFRDFLQRCKDYGVTDIEVPQSNTEQSENAVARTTSEQAKIAIMVQSRETKIKRYKEMKEVQAKLALLSQAVENPNVDEETKRQYYTTLLNDFVNQAVDELASIEQEKPILQYMAKHAGEPKPAQAPRAPLRPVIITRDAVQKAVYGAGYPALPAMTVEEFYDKRVRDGLFPAGPNIPHKSIQSAEEDTDESEKIHKEQLGEQDDPEELARKRAMDEYKDDHRRGWGNRHNRS